jgi:hypothetical protein
MVFEATDRDSLKPLGKLSIELIKTVLARDRTATPGDPAIQAEASELAELLTSVCRQGDDALCFPERPSGGKAAGKLRHFEGFGEGTQSYRHHEFAPFSVYWLGATVLIAAVFTLGAKLLSAVHRRHSSQSIRTLP